MRIEIKYALYLPAIAAFIYWGYTIAHEHNPTWTKAALNSLPLLVTMLFPSIVEYFLTHRSNKVWRLKKRKNIRALASLLLDKKWREKAAFALEEIGGEESAKALFNAITSEEQPSYDLIFSLSMIDEPIANRMLRDLAESTSSDIRRKAQRALVSQKERKENLASFHSQMQRKIVPQVKPGEIRDLLLAAAGRVEFDQREERETDWKEVDGYKMRVLEIGESVYNAGGIEALKKIYDQELATERSLESRARLSFSIKDIWSIIDQEVIKW